MGKKSKEPMWSLKDQQLWDLTTQSVTPLKRGKKSPSSTSIKTTVTKKRGEGTTEHKVTPFGKNPNLSKIAGAYRNENLSFQSPFHTDFPGIIEKSVLKKIRRNRMPVEAVLDLHGLTEAQAHRSVIKFVMNSVSHGHRTIMVITGKGLKYNDFGQLVYKGILRRLISIWLNQPPLKSHISGISQAAPHHGGAGALYVRLKY